MGEVGGVAGAVVDGAVAVADAVGVDGDAVVVGVGALHLVFEGQAGGQPLVW